MCVMGASRISGDGDVIGASGMSSGGSIRVSL